MSAFEVRIPPLGESVTEGVIARWAKGDGETVEQDEVLLELETDKASMEIAAERAGVLRILKREGETVQVGDVVARIEEGAGRGAGAGAEEAEDAEERTAGAERQVGPAEARAPRTEPSVALESAAPASAPAAGISEPGPVAAGEAARRVGPLSPAVRNLIEEHRLDPAEIPASGRGGRLTKGDVLAHLERREGAGGRERPGRAAPAAEARVAPAPPAPPPAAVPGEGEESVPMTRLRKRIAERLVEAQRTAAILTTFNEIDMSALQALRAAHRERFKERHGVSLGLMSFFARACIAALGELPAINAEIRGDAIVYKRFVHLGIAVGTERGLVVPVLHHAERMSFAEIEREILRLAGLARERKLAIDDLAGGTFTISNGGVYGSLLSTPILNPPQSGILGMHKIEKRPVVIGDEIVIRPMMYVALSYDHRIVDGEQAVTFLIRVKERIEDPARLLLDL
jgi:2-oxoglutarate dehydrogenase E2 component (dihydrolipoamide succinyltransferase)